MKYVRTRTGGHHPASQNFGYDTSEEALDRLKRSRPCKFGDTWFRSRWEATYAQHLEHLKDVGTISAWEYEADAFIFDGVRFGPKGYVPDFKVTDADGGVTYHEVKGWLDRLSRLKLKRMAMFYPEVAIILVDPRWCNG
jgi:hypothetical protein